MVETKIVKSNIVRETVFRKIIEEFELRKIIASIEGIKEESVKQFARRKSQSKMKNIDVLNAFKEFTGWSDDQIFEKLEDNNKN